MSRLVVEGRQVRWPSIGMFFAAYVMGTMLAESLRVSDVPAITFMLVAFLLIRAIARRWRAEVSEMVIDLEAQAIRCIDPPAIIPFTDLTAPVNIQVTKGTNTSTVTIRSLDANERQHVHFLRSKTDPRGQFNAAGLPVQVEMRDLPII